MVGGERWTERDDDVSSSTKSPGEVEQEAPRETHHSVALRGSVSYTKVYDVSTEVALHVLQLRLQGTEDVGLG